MAELLRDPFDPLAGARAILDAGSYWAEYEPIIELSSGKVVGYEALARFERPSGGSVSPGTFFSLVHAEPALLFRAELALKKHQLRHAPPGAELFLNLDPDSWVAAGEGIANPLLDLVAAAPGKVVVEVIENLDVGDVAASRGMVAALRARGLRVALDDVGAANSLLSFEAIDEAEVLKFDRTILKALGRPRRRSTIIALARMARETGGRTILEGVETPSDLRLAVELGVDMVQGWFFKELAKAAPLFR